MLDELNLGEDVLSGGNPATPPANPNNGNEPSADINNPNDKGDEQDVTNPANPPQKDKGSDDKGDKGDDKGDSKGGDDKDKHSSTGELEVGSIIEFDGKEYTVAKNGDLVDSEGKVFVKADQVSKWLEEQTEETEDEFDISKIIDAVGIKVNDENGNPVEFTNDVDGIKGYINGLLDVKAKESSEGAINKFFKDAPIVKEFVDYLTVNNGDPRGFGEIRDRSGIVVDKENVEQQKAIIKIAAAEFGNASLSDAYIKYLEESGNLYDEAVAQLEEIQKSDLARKQEIERRAAMVRQKDEADRREYWSKVENAINSKVIAGYKIPDTFVKEVDGKKMTYTINDFLDYVSKPSFVDEDNNKITGYQRDLNALSDEDLLNAELLDAWLKFTGGSYKDLVQMAVNANEVKRLKLVSKQHKTMPKVKTPSKPGKSGNISDIVFD